jgi:hypothetical protein
MISRIEIGTKIRVFQQYRGKGVIRNPKSAARVMIDPRPLCSRPLTESPPRSAGTPASAKSLPAPASERRGRRSGGRRAGRAWRGRARRVVRSCGLFAAARRRAIAAHGFCGTARRQAAERGAAGDDSASALKKCTADCLRRLSIEQALGLERQQQLSSRLSQGTAARGRIYQ